MLTIRDSQLKTFEADSKRAFEQALGAHLAAALPEAGQPAANSQDIQKIIQDGSAQAAQFGLKNESDVAQFITIAAVSQTDLSAPLPKPALAILQTHGGDPKEKLAQFQQLTGATVPKTANAFRDAPVGTAVQPCPGQDEASKRPVYSVEIQMIGEDGKPIPWEQYLVKLPNGVEVTGYLDGDGFSHIGAIETPGNCVIRFPNLDKEAWHRVETAALLQGAQ